MIAQAGLCQTWLKILNTCFLTSQLMFSMFIAKFLCCNRFTIHVIFPYFGGISLFLRKSPYLEFQNFSLYLIHLLIWNFRSIYKRIIMNFLLCLTHLSLAYLLSDIGKQNSPRCDAAPSGAILFAKRIFIEKLNKI